jgi:hypothetical protein
MTVATIRTGFLNGLLGLASDGEAIPWTANDRDGFIRNALSQAWPDLGLFVNATVAPSGASDVYTVPAILQPGLVSRVEVEYASGGASARVDRVTKWRQYSPTEVRIAPPLATDAAATLRFFGYVPFAADDPLDLPARLEFPIAMRAAAIAYGQMGSQLVNYKRQQGLDSPRVVDYQTAVGLSAYWERRYFEQISKDTARVSIAPRSSRR